VNLVTWWWGFLDERGKPFAVIQSGKLGAFTRKMATGGFGRKRSLTCAVVRSSKAEALKALKASKPSPAANVVKKAGPARSRARFWLVRIRRPGEFTPGSFRTIAVGSRGDLSIVGRLKGHTAMTVQAYRIARAHAPTIAAARAHVAAMRRGRNGAGPARSWTVNLVGGDLVTRSYTVEARTVKPAERKAIAAARTAGVPAPVKVVRVDRLGVRS